MNNDILTVKPDDSTLPYGVTADNIIKMIDAIKKKEGNEGAEFGAIKQLLRNT